MNKLLASLIVLCLPMAAGAAGKVRKTAAADLSCSLKAGSGPFHSFHLKNSHLTFQYASGNNGSVAGKDGVDVKNVDSASREQTYKFEIFESGDGTIYLAQDDDGTAAFIAYVSDGASSTGYYRCK